MLERIKKGNRVSRSEVSWPGAVETIIQEARWLALNGDDLKRFSERVRETGEKISGLGEDLQPEQLALFVVANTLRFLSSSDVGDNSTIDFLRKIKKALLASSPSEIPFVVKEIYRQNLISLCFGGWILVSFGVGAYNGEETIQKARLAVGETINCCFSFLSKTSEGCSGQTIAEGVEQAFSLLAPIKPDLLYCFNQETRNKVWGV